MKKLFFCVSLVLTGLMASCVDKYEEVPADELPATLGGSIYEELQKGESGGKLTGTFNTYLRLINDLGMDTTLMRTGSKTVFPANDEAFERFFKNNEWGVTSYEGLSDAKKKMLLRSSMLSNAMLIEMLSNVGASSGSTDNLYKGMALKHSTDISAVDSVTFLANKDMMPQANPYWEPYYDKGIYVVTDNTSPMMVHLTREYLVNNNISTLGEGSDFQIITGSPYSEEEKPAYVFSSRIIRPDVRCQNGYIHQAQDVVLNPGNMGQVMRKSKSTTIYSRIMDYFAYPEVDAATTAAYQKNARDYGWPWIDQIYQLRYLSGRSQGERANNEYPKGNELETGTYLKYDLGWNGYFPKHTNNSGIEYSQTDMGTLFVPSDEAVRKYFSVGQPGAYLIEIYGKKPNTEENLVENLDSMMADNPKVLASFINNIQKESFSACVPSKFPTITNDATEIMGLSTDKLQRNADGTYDIKIANNGIIYTVNEMLAPDEFRSVMGPASSYKDMRVMNWAINDRTILGVDFKFYLLAMSANYAFFIPEDSAFSRNLYIDPTTLGYPKSSTAPGTMAMRFYRNELGNIMCDRYLYDMEKQEIVGGVKDTKTMSQVVSQFVDILNYHTVVLPEGKTIADNRFFLTKHGGAICIDGYKELDPLAKPNVSGTVSSGAQMNNGISPSNITQVYHQGNGKAYRIDRVIQPPVNSVYKTLKENDQFTEFFKVCDLLGDAEILKWAGIDDQKVLNATEQDKYIVFTNTYNGKASTCLDQNVKMFKTYHYTLYAPNNDAMKAAYAAGLPNPDELETRYNDNEKSSLTDDELKPVKEQMKKELGYLRDFVRYHFQTGSVFADRNIDLDNPQKLSLLSDDLGVAKELTIGGGSDVLTVTDLGGVTHTIKASDAQQGKMVNQMARDYWFNGDVRDPEKCNKIETSSFCTIHEVSQPLFWNSTKRFDVAQ